MFVCLCVCHKNPVYKRTCFVLCFGIQPLHTKVSTTNIVPSTWLKMVENRYYLCMAFCTITFELTSCILYLCMLKVILILRYELIVRTPDTFLCY